MTAQCYKTTWINYHCGSPSGTWNSTPLSARWCGWQRPGKQSTQCILYMVRSWKLSQALSTWGLTSPVAYPGTPTLTELLEMQIELWDTFGEILNQKTKKWEKPPITRLSDLSWSMQPLFGILTLRKKHFSLKKFKEGPHAGRPVIMITGQVLHLCLTNSVGEPLSKDGLMPAFVSSTRWSMELWQYPSQITSSLHIECPVTVTQWHFVRSIQTGIIISIHSFHWL